MQRLFTPLILLCAAAMLAACSRNDAPPAPPVAAPETARTIAQGEVIGLVTEDGAHAWRGLPFAATTGGENRWRAPRPAPGWDGTRAAIEFGPRCAQISNRLNEPEGIEPGKVLGSEDCLSLNIFAPPDAAGKELPVMVWIHGGANVWGRAASYDGSRLAVNEDVIIVTVQYRLGALGWFAHEMIRATAGNDLDRTANFATLDLIASLQWVRDNIAAFGGNPENVTIFGESAGGHNVASLLASPVAAGLFQRAIIQSGSFDSYSLAEAETEFPRASNKVVAELGVASADALRALPLEELLFAYWDPEGAFAEMPRIIEDGVVLPAGPMRDAFASMETFNAVPIITGTNRDEMKFFYLADPRLTKQFLGLFTVARDQRFYDAISEYTARVWRVRAVDGPAGMMAAAGHTDVYAYRFDWDEGGRFLFSDLSRLVGAGHAIEIPFVFNRFRLLGDADRIMFTKGTTDSRQALSRTMGDYWASFAASGQPAAAGAPAWPVYSTEGGSLMRFDSAEDGGIEVITGADSMEALLDDLANDPDLDEVEKCLIGSVIVEWVPWLEQTIRTRLACED